MIDPDTAMTGGELQTIREYLGLTGEQLAALLEVTPRTVRAWEAGDVPIPTARREGRTQVREALKRLEDDATAAVDKLAAALSETDTPVVVVYRTDDDLHDQRPELPRLPARWWRQIVARATSQVPDVKIREYGPVDLYDGIGGSLVARVKAVRYEPVTHDGVEYSWLSGHSIGTQPAKLAYVPTSVFKGGEKSAGQE